MKFRLLYFALLVFALYTISACSRHSHPVHSSKPLPPGQAKKISGSKSAKAYAPGQQKKKR